MQRSSRPVPLPGLTNLSSATFEAWLHSESSKMICLKLGTKRLVFYDLEERVLHHSLNAPSHIEFTSGLINGCLLVNQKDMMEKLDFNVEPKWDEGQRLHDLLVQHVLSTPSDNKLFCVTPEGHVYTWESLMKIANSSDTSLLNSKASENVSSRKLVSCRIVESSKSSVNHLLMRYEDESYKLFSMAMDDEDVSLKLVFEGKSEMVDVVNTSSYGLRVVCVDEKKVVVKGIEDDDETLISNVIDNSAQKITLLKAMMENYVLLVTEDRNEKKSHLKVVHCVFGAVVMNIEVEGRVQSVDVVQSTLLFTVENKMYMIDTSELPRDMDELMGWQTPQTKSTMKENSSQHCSEAVRLYHELPCAMEKDDLGTVSELITKAKDVPESLVVRVLKFLLENNDEGDLTRREQLWLRVLQIPITPSMINGHLATLGLDEVLKMIEQLDYALKLCLCESNTAFDVGSLLQWVDLVLNSHYCTMLLSRDERALQRLESLLQCIARLEKGVSVCVTLLPFISLIQQRQKIVTTAARKDIGESVNADSALYLIESISL